MHFEYHARFCNSCSFCCGTLVCVFSVYNIDMHLAKIVHTFIVISTVRNALYNIIKCTVVIAKLIQTIVSFAICSKTMQKCTLNPQLFHAKMQNKSRKSTIVLAIKCSRTDSDLLTNVTSIA